MVETLLVYHTYHTPYLIISFPPKIFSVADNPPLASHHRPQTRSAAGESPFSLFSSLSLLLSRGDPPPTPPQPPAPSPPFGPPTLLSGPPPPASPPRLPLSLPLSLSTPPQPRPPHTTPDVRRERKREGELRVGVGWGGALGGRGWRGRGSGKERKGKRERGKRERGRRGGREGGRWVGLGGRGAGWGPVVGGRRRGVIGGEEKREKGEERERKEIRRRPAGRPGLRLVVGSRRWVAGDGEEFGWKGLCEVRCMINMIHQQRFNRSIKSQRLKKGMYR
ncbi:hypothetical protein TIFTF001_002947 [Ficus carica]|uniref:Uncharacterized protein n=1 Tax=Ficus carica TaxID=3494 RepID=A0AA88CT88_FICCA|nr:hypothetical protein TIFTF001_002947 [Ficus carica]